MRSSYRETAYSLPELPSQHQTIKEFITLEDLDFILNSSHGIRFANQFNMAFVLTSTQEASHNFIHPELTNCTISVELKLDAGLANNVKLFFMGERLSTVSVPSN